ncbi:MAG: hypothetical protein IJX45_10120 [Spirochaetaceae bacterium]|nr:hypothetical protein [Spirochaetaceae bacterium]
MGKKKGSRGKDYFGMGRLISIIFAIIPVTSWLFGFVTRFQEGKIVAGLLRLLLGWNIIWILDLLCILFQGKILRLLNF